MSGSARRSSTTRAMYTCPKRVFHTSDQTLGSNAFTGPRAPAYGPCSAKPTSVNAIAAPQAVQTMRRARRSLRPVLQT